jgi:hypothetical protein
MEAHQAATQNLTAQRESHRQIAEWVMQLNAEDCTAMRQTSALWKTWRRMQEHRSVTGHAFSMLPIPPNALSNPN